MIKVEDLVIELKGFTLKVEEFEAKRNEYVIIMGASGTGKSVFVEGIAGFLKPKRGRIVIDGKDVTYLPPEKRGIAIVPQDHGLWPHMSVYENIAFPLRIRKVNENEIRRNVKELAERLNIEHLLNRSPSKLSGGERQRVALARALIIRPQVLLLDEPTSSLDPKTRKAALELLKMIKGSVTVVHVTHNPYEALVLGDKIAVMNRGRLGRPKDPREVLLNELSYYVDEIREATSLIGL
ncbi:ABC transporter ATPase [Ignicoccus pacificus DSM 13166]|uniref:Molybdate/tungstate import ATP-binding protein WtpC n=1 Tax=Ignicoccus pacificus DSM 13166 TaxID=940294 RepID=A0A977K8V8_9CREN|nr:ABC transporter ATPase [Ignicoccus pacificus DSM 13166]